MRQVKYAKALRQAHEKTAHALAEREATGLAGAALRPANANGGGKA